MAEVSKGREGRQRLGWMDDMMVALGSRGMAGGGYECRKEFRALVHM